MGSIALGDFHYTDELFFSPYISEQVPFYFSYLGECYIPAEILWTTKLHLALPLYKGEKIMVEC